MIEEILSSIKEAEQKAEAIRAEAEQKATDIGLKTADDCDDIVKKATDEVKKLKAENLLNAEKTAKAHYLSAISDAENSAKQQRASLEKTIKALGEEIYGRVLDGNL